MRDKIVTAVLGDDLYVKTSHVFQYDYGLTLMIEGIQLPAEYEVHFSNKKRGVAKKGELVQGGAKIPDEYLRSGDNVYAWVYIRHGDDDGYTVYSVEIPVVQRSVEQGDNITIIEHNIIDEAIAALEDAVEKTDQNVRNYPYINEENHHWMVYDADEEEFVDTGVRAKAIDVDPTILIDDTAGAGDLNKTWSADKLVDVYDDLRERTDDLIAIQDETPVDDSTKVWLPETPPEGVQVPTYEDMENLIAVQDETPTNDATEIWLPETPPQSVQVPSYQEFTNLQTTVSGKVNEPATEGSAGQVLTTDGQGGRSWTTVENGVVIPVFEDYWDSQARRYKLRCSMTYAQIASAIREGKCTGAIIIPEDDGEYWYPDEVYVPLLKHMDTTKFGKNPYICFGGAYMILEDNTALSSGRLAYPTVIVNSDDTYIYNGIYDSSQYEEIRARVINSTYGTTISRDISPLPTSYNFGTKNSVTVNVSADAQYRFMFTCPVGLPTVLTMNGVTETYGDDIEAGKTYIVDIWSGIATIAEKGQYTKDDVVPIFTQTSSSAPLTCNYTFDELYDLISKGKCKNALYLPPNDDEDSLEYNAVLQAGSFLDEYGIYSERVDEVSFSSVQQYDSAYGYFVIIIVSKENGITIEKGRTYNEVQVANYTYGTTFTRPDSSGRPLYAFPLTYNLGVKNKITLTINPAKQYKFMFTCPANAATVLSITGITETHGATLEANKTYILDIWAGIATITEKNQNIADAFAALSGKISEPSTEGTSGQVLTTDGNGGRSWTTVQSGSSDYASLTNKPQIAGVTLSGNKSLSDLGIASEADLETKTEQFFVNLTGNADSSTEQMIITSDKTVSEILAAKEANKLIVCSYVENQGPPLSSIHNDCFIMFHDPTQDIYMGVVSFYFSFGAYGSPGYSYRIDGMSLPYESDEWSLIHHLTLEDQFTDNDASDVSFSPQFSAFAGRIIDLATPVDGTDAATKDYVDGITSGKSSNEMIAYVEEDNTSDNAYAIGDIFVYDGKLYKATSAIAANDYIIPNTNCTETSVDEVRIKDVQVNGTSIVSQGVANIPIASLDNLGVVKVATNDSTTTGLKKNSSGQILIVPAASVNIKAPSSSDKRPIVPNTQHEATFYGLAKAAGDATQSASSNAVGTYTDGAKSAIQSMLDVPSKDEASNLIIVSDTEPTETENKLWINNDDLAEYSVPTMIDMNTALAGKVGDVQVNGTSVVSNGTANILMATAQRMGVIQLGTGFSTNSSGVTNVNFASASQIQAGATQGASINPYAQHRAAFFGLAKAAGVDLANETVTFGTYPAAAKAAIKSMLGITDVEVVRLA